MNGRRADGVARVRTLCDRLAAGLLSCEVAICPPATLLREIAELTAESPLAVGGQDCHEADSGAHTGDVSAVMLADAGCVYVIVGHSERRADHGESDALVRAKAVAAHRAGLAAIVCLGESGAERDAGETLAVVEAQLAGSLPPEATAADTVIAYEPVWAIGSGRTPSESDIATVHAHLRDLLEARLPGTGGAVRILYGGSVKPSNAAAILAVPEVNGALVGGASLDVDDFWKICQSCL